MTGTIKNLVKGKYFGFIKMKNHDREYFFHKEDFHGFWDDLVTDFESDRHTSIEVTFDVVESPKGPRAANVSRTDYPNGAQ